jgi:hypothetical protein
MNKLLAFIDNATAFEAGVVSAILIAAGLMFAVVLWEITYALDRATNLIIKFLYTPITWVAYRAIQAMVLIFIAAALYMMVA